MTLRSSLMAGSLPWEIADKLGYDPIQAVTAAGTTQGTATALNTNCANVTTSTISGGVIINQPQSSNYIYNSGPNTLTIYPPVGSNFVGLAANVGFTLAINNGIIIEGDGTTLLPMFSN